MAIIMFGLLLPCACEVPQRDNIIKQGHPLKTIEELKAAVETVMARHSVPGAGLAIVSRDRPILIAGLGWADIHSAHRADRDTLFRIASITKTFVALSIMQLQEKGQLLLDDPIRAQLPGKVINPWEQSDPVRIENLLEHTAGLDDCSPATFYVPAASDPESATPFSMLPQWQRVLWRPGLFFYYSNVGYGLVGELIETVSGHPFDDYIERQILAPLGMKSTVDRLTPVVRERLAQGYEGSPLRPVPYRPAYIRAAAGFMSSPMDMARFVRMLLNNGRLETVRIVTAESLARMQTSQTSIVARAGVKDGYGTGLGHESAGGVNIFGNSGDIAGFLSEYKYIPALGSGFFFALNVSSPEAYIAKTEIEEVLLDYLLRGVKKSSQPTPPASSDPEGCRRWVGFYQLVTPGQSNLHVLDHLYGGINVRERGGKLYYQALGEPQVELIAEGNSQFRLADGGRAKLIFSNDREMGQVMISKDGSFVRGPELWPHLRLMLFRFVVFLLLTAPLATLLYCTGPMISHMPPCPASLAMGIAATLFIIDVLICYRLVRGATDLQLASVNAVTATLFVGGWLLTALATFQAIMAVVLWRAETGVTAGTVYCTMLAAASAGFTLYLTYWGLVGRPFWAM